MLTSRTGGNAGREFHSIVKLTRQVNVFHLYSINQAPQSKAALAGLDSNGPMKKKIARVPNRDCHLRVRLTVKEKKKLEREARVRGMRLSDYVRSVLTEKSFL